MSARPNIIFFVPDSYRGDVLNHQGNGGAVTPNLDAVISNGGVSYKNAFAQNPVCTPSRCSFMTGWYPHTHGHRSMKNMLKPHEPNLFKVLQKEDYYIWWGGKNDLMAVKESEDYLVSCDVKFKPQERHYVKKYERPTPRGCNDDAMNQAFYSGICRESAGEPENQYRCGDTAVVNGAVEFINEKDNDKPFFMFLPLTNPHPAYIVEEEFYSLIDVEKLPPRINEGEKTSAQPEVLEEFREIYAADKLTEYDWREIKKVYYAMCTKIDHLFGLVVEALKKNCLYDDTMIFFFSDHGDFAGDYSLVEKTHSTLQDNLLNIPLLIKPHKGVEVKEGCRNELAELTDLTATIYDLLDIDPGYTYQGKSLRKSLAEGDPYLHDAVFAEVGARKSEDAFLNEDVLSLPPESFYSRQGEVSHKWHKVGSHAVMCRTAKYKYIRRFYTKVDELYDLEKDPGEIHNVLDYFMETSDVMPHEVDSRSVK
jgi:arylsulfatase A-like enzyme